MRIVAYHKEGKPGEHWRFHPQALGHALPDALGQLMGAGVMHIALEDKPMQKYDIIKDDFDLAYCQKYEMPKERPAPFVYTFCGDIYKHEDMIKEWIDFVRPNMVGFLESTPTWLFEYCIERNCEPVFFPWFILDENDSGYYAQKPYNESRDVLGLCSGCVGRAYPSRTAINNYLAGRKIPGIILSCASYGNYLLSDLEYRDVLNRTCYYITGPVWDRDVSPKYIEAMNYGCAIVSPWVSSMEKYGFVPGNNMIELKDLDKIEEIVNSNLWVKIGQAGRDLVLARHTVKHRALLIRDIYLKWKKRQ